MTDRHAEVQLSISVLRGVTNGMNLNHGRDAEHSLPPIGLRLDDPLSSVSHQGMKEAAANDSLPAGSGIPPICKRYPRGILKQVASLYA